MAIGLHHIIKLFKDGNVCVVGMRGTGKDMLMANVCARRGIPYVSNIDYGGLFYEYNYNGILDMNGNTFQDVTEGNIKAYTYPFQDGTDIYLSDCGIYFPSQECSFLDRKYKGIPLFMALSRQLGQCNVHLNCQNLERIYTKMREQSDIFIRCEWCKVIKGYVFQSVLVYSQADACQRRVPPCPYSVPIFAPRESKELYRMKIIDYGIAYGDIHRVFLVYKNKSTYNTYHFKEVFANGKKN